MLHGRERELTALQDRLRAARDGRSFALVVAGEAGIGKSALLEEVLASEPAAGFRILRARGFESEAEIPYAGLLEIVRPLLDLAADLPEQQAAALRSALALGPPTPHDRFAVPVAVLGLLGAAAEEGPLLVVVDDAHWLDGASREALLFAARRLRAEGVGVLLGVRRTDGATAFDVAGLEVLELSGLTPVAARAVLAGRVAPSVADVLVASTGGNPLALLELPAVLSEDERRGLRAITAPLPAGDRIGQLFSDQVAALPERTRRALGVAAAVDASALGQLFGALHGLGLSEQDLAPAEQAGVITVRTSELRFRHPLVRSAAYAAQPVAERHAAHAALADAAVDTRAAAWHRAQATTRPDEGVAADLADAADDALRRGGRAEAAVTFARAAQLTPDPAVAAQRMLAAAEAAHDAGDADRADALLGSAEAGPLGPGAQRDARRLRALLLGRAGDTVGAVAILEREAERLRSNDPVGAAATLLVSAPAYMHTGDFPAMIDMATRAGALAGDDPVLGARASDMGALARHAMGTADPAWLERLAAAATRDLASGLGEVTIAAAEGVSVTGRADQALRALDGHVAAARAAGDVLMLTYALAVRASARHLVGRAAEARADAHEAVELQRDLGHVLIFSGYLYAIAALIAADAGQQTQAAAYVAEALEASRRSGSVTIRLWTGWAEGRLALIEDRVDDAVVALRDVEATCARLAWGSANAALPFADLAEAVIRTGDADGARAVLPKLAALAGGASQLPGPLVARVEALLAPDDDFEGAFARAIEAMEPAGMPLELARTRMLLGARRRRARRDADAREPLQAAIAAFEQLGAEAWAAQAREELRRAGARQAVATGGDPAQVLSAQEFRIAQLVAQGMTNREVGGELFLSPKTIEHHLSSIYRKLGVRSRTQLTSLLGPA